MPNSALVVCDENILGGIPVFAGTRVPVKTLFDYLKANHPLADFLDDFPTVTPIQAKAMLDHAAQDVVQLEEVASNAYSAR